MYSIGAHLRLNTADSSKQLCAVIRSCIISCEWLKGMNLTTTPVARFTALNPQHNLALQSDGPISRQIAQHPTLTRNARSSPRILNYEYCMSLRVRLYVFLPIDSRKWAHIGLSTAMKNHVHRMRFQLTPVIITGFTCRPIDIWN
jgi:hypothetical protein